MWHIQDKHVKVNQRENADKTNNRTDKVKEHAACNMEVDPQLSINGPSTAIFEKKNVTITKKLSDPKVGTHYQIFVQEQNQEKLACFTAVCPHCNVDFSSLVSNKIECFENSNKNISEKNFFMENRVQVTHYPILKILCLNLKIHKQNQLMTNY